MLAAYLKCVCVWKNLFAFHTIHAFELWCWKKTPESPLGCKEIKLVNPKGNWSEYSLEGLMLKLQYFGHLMRRTESLKKTLMLGKPEGRRQRGRQRMRWLDGITDLMDMSFEQAPGVGEGQGSLVCCSPWGCKKSDMTERLNCWKYLLLLIF